MTPADAALPRSTLRDLHLAVLPPLAFDSLQAVARRARTEELLRQRLQGEEAQALSTAQQQLQHVQHAREVVAPVGGDENRLPPAVRVRGVEDLYRVEAS